MKSGLRVALTLVFITYTSLANDLQLFYKSIYQNYLYDDIIHFLELKPQHCILKISDPYVAFRCPRYVTLMAKANLT